MPLNWTAADGQGPDGKEVPKIPEACSSVFAENITDYEALARGNRRKFEPKKLEHPRGIKAAVCSYIALIRKKGRGEQERFFNVQPDDETRFTALNAVDLPKDLQWPDPAR